MLQCYKILLSFDIKLILKIIFEQPSFSPLMANVLKITKADKTVHVVPTANKAFFQSFNNRLPHGAKWKIEEIDEKEAKGLPFIDEDYVTGAEATVKVDELKGQLSEKDQQIEALKAQLEAMQNPAPSGAKKGDKTQA